MRPIRVREPFDGDDWIFEIKYDGFRALAYVAKGKSWLVSRNGHTYRAFPALCESVGAHLRSRNAVLDGEIVCLSADGRPVFNQLLCRRDRPVFYTFDLLWLDGLDLRGLPLLKRKAMLRRVVPEEPSPVLYADHIEAAGTRLFAAVCEMDIEGIVAKWNPDCYLCDGETTTWIKIKNPNYSQARDRHELFAELRRNGTRSPSKRAALPALVIPVPGIL